jgi:hypothetical protein
MRSGNFRIKRNLLFSSGVGNPAPADLFSCAREGLMGFSFFYAFLVQVNKHVGMHLLGYLSPQIVKIN